MSQDPHTATVQQHLDVLKKHIHKVLKDALPKICSGSSNWWDVMVRGVRMRGSQTLDIQEGKIKTLGKLDLVSLCHVLKHQLRPVLEHIQSHDEQHIAYITCEAIINLRNQISHQGVDSAMMAEDTLAALLNIKKLGTLLHLPSAQSVVLDQDIQQITIELSGIPQTPPAPVTTVKGESPPKNIPNTRSSEDERLPGIPDQGISLQLLTPNSEMSGSLEAALAETTFVGIDFGTSTTVASRVFIDPETKILKTQPIPIRQKDTTGRTIDNHLLPTCVCWHDGQLLVGEGAAALKSELSQGVDIWSSFKMELGIDLGPKYYRSKLDGKTGPVEIRKPQDVATCFFQFLREQIETWVKDQGLPEHIQYAVSVPASFEPNQRLDLCRVMEAAGIRVHNNNIIDEPNAAFISYLLDTLDAGDGILKAFGDRARKVMVFDFGAGTCDISVLDVGCEGDRLISRNLAISQFRALGGDNIDRCIARRILWPAMRDAANGEDHIRSVELEQVILPRLHPAAEQLKIQCCKWLSQKGQGGRASSYADSTRSLSTGPVKPTVIRKTQLSLDTPQINIAEFFGIMEPFLDQENLEPGRDDVISVFEPVSNALKKAEISHEQLDMVLFIGGSAQNPLVQEAISRYVGRFVECIVGRDVRTPVSRGAALHSLAWNGLNMQFIKPIISESIYIVTRGGLLHPILSAGTPIPTPEIEFSDSLIVAGDGQSKIELPICVSNEKKILHVIELSAKTGSSFHSGDRITVSCHLDENKLLHVSAKLGAVMAQAKVTNPLANESLTPEETRRLLARQRLNESIVAGRGKPEPSVLEEFAKACADSGFHLEAAESFEGLERISARHKTPENATSICFHYGRSDKTSLSDEWAEISYQRRPNWVSAFNLAITMRTRGNAEKSLGLLEEARDMSPDNPVVMEALARQYQIHGRAKESEAAYDKARAGFKDWIARDTMDRYDIERAVRVAKYFKDSAMELALEKLRARLSAIPQVFDEENLAASTAQSQRTH
ncbi:MAG: Hsp70 family protein [Verrucomicrobiales bacterium]|nr:Hsp70 family protein [Verrucomicrobiota bacterium JB025]